MGEENNIMQVTCQYGSQIGLLTIRAIKRSIFDEDSHYYSTGGTRLSISCRAFVNGRFFGAAWKNSQPEIDMQLSQSIKLIQLIYYLFGSHTLTT